MSRMAILKAGSGKWDEAVAFSRKAVRLRAMSPTALEVHVRALAHTGHCSEAAFYMTALSRPAPGTGQRGADIPAPWRRLHERCTQIAAERAQRRAEPTIDGGDGGGGPTP